MTDIDFKSVFNTSNQKEELDKTPSFDLNKSEIVILTCLAIPTLLFGFYPEPLINTIEVSINDLIETHNIKIVSR